MPASRFPQEIQEHIFERFFRGDTARTPVDGGAGLGLAVARWVARAHGGGIEVSSSPGQGTRFLMRLQRSAMNTEQSSEQ